MQIRVKSIPGDEYLLSVENDLFVSQLKERVCDKSAGRAPACRQKLVYKGRTMQDTSLLGDYNLEEDCKIHLILQKDPNPIPSNPAQASDAQYSAKLANQSAYVPSRFEVLLRKKLSGQKGFTADRIDRIMMHLHQEIETDVNSSSLDDLERLAKQKLNICNE